MLPPRPRVESGAQSAEREESGAPRSALRAANDEDTPCARLDQVLGDYLDALERGCAPPREEFLAAHPDLAEELAEFLRDQDRLDAVMAPLVGHSSANGSAARAANLPQAGETIGPYQLLEEVGRGGMGVVYRALQTGANRVVAFKMIAAGLWATPADLQRFRLEASAIAEMDHPHIVPLYEVGEWRPDGSAAPVPYYSMKWIEGGSLARALAGGAWPTAGRDAQRRSAALLLTVARAVEHAHRHGVLHRDLKPGNILLSIADCGLRIADSEIPQSAIRNPQSAIPYVTDFGLAKRLTAGEGGAEQPTLSGTALGTPSYMAPEQARNARAATTAADVYSLGAILYECLTGRPPFRCETSLETLLDVLERDPEPPGKLCPGLDRDLETICLKCLHKEPRLRYPGAGALANDLERYLNGQSIQARRLGRVERLARRIRRQPLVAALIASVFVSVVVGVVLVFLQWRRAEDLSIEYRKERDEARTQRALAEQNRKRAEENLTAANTQRRLAEENRVRAEDNLMIANTQRALAEDRLRQAREVVEKFCIRLSEEKLRQYPGLHELRMELLEAGLAYYLGFLKESAESDPRLKGEVAIAHARVGDLNGALGRREEALRVQTEAVRLLRLAADQAPDDPGYRKALAGGLLNLARHRNSIGDSKGAREALDESLQIWERLKEKYPNSPDVDTGIAAAMSNRSNLDRGAASPTPGPATAEEVVAINRRLVGRDPDRIDYLASLGRALLNLGLAYNGLGRREDTFKAFDESRRLLEKVVTHEPTNDHKLSVARVCRHLANWCKDNGRDADAIRHYEHARGLLEEMTRQEGAIPEFQAELSALLSDQGGFYLSRKKRDEGVDCYEQSLAIRKRLVEDHPGVTTHELGLAQSYHNIGLLYHREQQPAQALQYYQEGATLFRKLLRATPENVSHASYLAGTLNNTADVLQMLNRFPEAMKVFEETVRIQRAAVAAAPQSRTYRTALSNQARNLARAYRRDNRPGDSVALLLELRQLWPNEAAELVKLVKDLALSARLSPPRSPERGRHVDLAIETLSMTLASGHRDFRGLRADPDLTLLRERAEFEQLLLAFESK